MNKGWGDLVAGILIHNSDSSITWCLNPTRSIQKALCLLQITSQEKYSLHNFFKKYLITTLDSCFVHFDIFSCLVISIGWHLQCKRWVFFSFPVYTYKRCSVYAVILKRRPFGERISLGAYQGEAQSWSQVESYLLYLLVAFSLKLMSSGLRVYQLPSLL